MGKTKLMCVRVAYVILVSFLLFCLSSCYVRAKRDIKTKLNDYENRVESLEKRILSLMRHGTDPEDNQEFVDKFNSLLPEIRALDTDMSEFYYTYQIYSLDDDALITDEQADLFTDMMYRVLDLYDLVERHWDVSFKSMLR
ncbi:MAG: hypothetical protein RBS43_07540 [Candidatus Cloacimonas sp.]|jgi:hypothetical protein|nr:hypothetical protein [Candidatus Cloacimonas sp.]